MGRDGGALELSSEIVVVVHHPIVLLVLTGGATAVHHLTLLQAAAAAVAGDAMGLTLQARVAHESVVELAVQTRALVLTLRVLSQVGHICLTHVVARLGQGAGLMRRRLQVWSCVYDVWIDIVRVGSISEPPISLSRILEVR